MHLDGSIAGDKSHDGVAIDGVAAAREFVVDSLHVVANHEYVVAASLFFFSLVLQHKVLGSLTWLTCFLQLGLIVEIFFYQGGDVNFAFINSHIEIGCHLVAFFADESAHSGFVNLYLAVFETTLHKFAPHIRLLRLSLVESLLNLVTGLAGLDNIKPIDAWHLR